MWSLESLPPPWHRGTGSRGGLPLTCMLWKSPQVRHWEPVSHEEPGPLGIPCINDVMPSLMPQSS